MLHIVLYPINSDDTGNVKLIDFIHYFTCDAVLAVIRHSLPKLT